MSANAPHKAILKFQILVHEVLPSGELSPHLIPDDELIKYGIGKFASLFIEGANRAECLKNIKERLDKLNPPSYNKDS